MHKLQQLRPSAFFPLPLNRSGQAGSHSQTFQPRLLHRALSLDPVHPLPHTHTHTQTSIPGHMDSTQQVSQIKTGTEALVFPGFSEWLPLHGAYFTSLHHLHHLSAPAALTSPMQPGATHQLSNTHRCKHLAFSTCRI